MCFNLNIARSITFLFPKFINLFEFFLIINQFFILTYLSSIIIAISISYLTLASGPTRTVLNERWSATIQSNDDILAIKIVM